MTKDKGDWKLKEKNVYQPSYTMPVTYIYNAYITAFQPLLICSQKFIFFDKKKTNYLVQINNIHNFTKYSATHSKTQLRHR